MNNIDFNQIELKKIITHQIGNKLRDEKFLLSNNESVVEENSKNYLLKYFFSSIKPEEFHCFTHAIEINMNEIFLLVKSIFTNAESFLKNSQNIAKLLYEQSLHPKIKEGQLNIAYFTGISINDKLVDGIGFFKSESNSPFIQIKKLSSNFSINHEYGFDIKEMDKGCLIINEDEENGYNILIIDRNNKVSEAQYWKNDFLNVKPKNTEYHQTNHILGIAKNFVKNGINEDLNLSKTEKIEILNRSVDYFKSNDSFDKMDFENKVFSETKLIDSFNKYSQDYQENHDLELSDNFEISKNAVKKQAKIFKKILKLDKNFHIYIHGNTQLIEQGIENDGRKFYKLYFNEEN